MAITFAGKQAGYPDPVATANVPPPACGSVTFVGKQAGYADPTLAGCLPRLRDER